MRKSIFSVAVVLALGGSMLFSSCIGQFALTNKVLGWNNQVGNKFVNEVVFICFWILPVYEVTALADILVINSIEFWSGSNPMTASSRTVKTDSGTYMIAQDQTGYTISCKETGESTRLNFNEEDQSWNIEVNGENVPFMTFVDDNRVKVLSPEGDYQMVSLDEEGLMAYREACGINGPMMAFSN